ncbi:MAG: cyclic nucleotide-binding domain-containing protein [Deltaproteobacteria bacterium]|nr:cyclic nucleotide-binding domain-containing protein [Deltaproteobacteria bacterium]
MANSQDLLKRAAKAEADGQLGDAAVLFERAGDTEHAIATYKKAGNVDRAAVLLDSTGRGKEAAALLASVGQFEKAALLYEKTKDYAKAAAALLRANHRERAAAMYERAENFEDAAKIYQSLGNHRKAMQLYGQAGNEAKVSELQAQVQPEPGAEQQAAQGVMAHMDVAASGYVDSARLVEGIAALLRAGRQQDAAKVYETCQEDIGYNIIAAVAGDPPTELKAAEMFFLAKDYGKAGQLLENHEEYERAGMVYERGDDFYMAGEMYVRAGNKAKAAEMFEKHGDYQHAAEFYLAVNNFEKAAENFERSVNHFVAGKLYFRMNKMNKSIQLLQKVQKSESQYFEAARIIGEILSANGYLDLAVKKYMEVVQSAELTKDTAPVFYNLGKTLEQRGESAQALGLYQKLAGWQFDYEDVAARIKALASAPAKAAPAPAAPAAPAADALGLGGDGPPGEGKLVAMMDGFEFLKGTPLFRDLSLEEMKAVYHACETRKFKAGEVIIEQDTPGQALYVLRKGSARVLRVANGKEEAVARMGPGSPAGEMSLVDDSPTSARVVAEVEVEAFCITRSNFERLMHLNERMALKIYRFFVQTLSKRLRNTSENLAKASAARASA